MSEPFISVVVPVRDGERHLRDCLASLSRLDYPSERHELLVVDNGSRDGTAGIAHQFGIRCIYESAAGAGNARNAGAAAAKGDLLAFLDCDCRAATGWLTELAAQFADGVAAAVAGEIVAMPPRGVAERYAARRKPLWQEWTRLGRSSVYLVAANCALRRDAFARVGGFDRRFYAGEDIELSLRLAREGLEIRHAPRALVFHRHRSTVLGLAMQQFDYARGQALISRAYSDEFQWGVRGEARAWLDLGAKLPRLVKALPHRATAEYEAIDLVRRLAQRLGFARGAVTARSALR